MVMEEVGSGWSRVDGGTERQSGVRLRGLWLGLLLGLGLRVECTEEGEEKLLREGVRECVLVGLRLLSALLFTR